MHRGCLVYRPIEAKVYSENVRAAQPDPETFVRRERRAQLPAEARVAKEPERIAIDDCIAAGGDSKRGDAERDAEATRREIGQVPESLSSASGVLRGTRPAEAAGAGVRTVGLAVTIPRELERRGWIDLRGREVRSPQDLAALAQVYRDPRIETFRIYFVKNGSLLAHASLLLAFSARAPPAPRPRRIITFGAHPDDCERVAAGSAAKWTAFGHVSWPATGPSGVRP